MVMIYRQQFNAITYKQSKPCHEHDSSAMFDVSAIKWPPSSAPASDATPRPPAECRSHSDERGVLNGAFVL
jgi:hypothetical protein